MGLKLFAQATLGYQPLVSHFCPGALWVFPTDPLVNSCWAHAAFDFTQMF